MTCYGYLKNAETIKTSDPCYGDCFANPELPYKARIVMRICRDDRINWMKLF